MKIQLSGLVFWLRTTVLAMLILVVPTVTTATVVDWNTFVGSSDADEGRNIAVDSDGNVYVTGYSNASWGNPVNDHTGGDSNVFVAKFDSGGNLSWNTFLGSSLGSSLGYGITVDSNGNVYVTGYSEASWGNPVNDHAGSEDAFVAKLDSSGNLSWNTFLGSSGDETSRSIVVGDNGHVYVTGESQDTWGDPVNIYAGGNEAFIAKLDNNGNLSWNTFLGSASDDKGIKIALSDNDMVYVIGPSKATWGNPVNPHAGGNHDDAFVAKLDGSGNLSWNTFLGSPVYDYGLGIAVNDNDTVYILGSSGATWGNPVNPYVGNSDVFIAQLSNNGNLNWNTFLGSLSDDHGNNIAAADNGMVYVVGYTDATWGNPVNPHTGNGLEDVFVAKISSSGNLDWNTFLGSPSDDYGNGIAVSDNDMVYVTGYSQATWGNPVNAYAGNYDAFVAQLTTLTTSDPSNLQFSLATFQAAENSGQAVIKVSRTGNINGSVSVDYASSDDTAASGSDYTAAAGTLTWDDGESGEKSFMVNLIDDTEVEGNESIILTLENITGEAVLGSPQMATLIVVDDDYSENGCKHAIYSLDDQTLAIPAVEVPILSIIDQQPTGESVMLTSILKQQPTEPTQFGIWFLSEVFPEVIVAASVCPASYSLTSGVLSLPWVDIPVVAQLGSQQSEVGVKMFKVIMQWRSDLDLFVVEEIQRVE